MSQKAGSRCPQCGEFRIHRSREHGLKEVLLKTLFNKKPYRCHNCGWRDLINKTKKTDEGGGLATGTYIKIILLALLFAIYVAYYVTSKAPPPPFPTEP